MLYRSRGADTLQMSDNRRSAVPKTAQIDGPVEIARSLTERILDRSLKVGDRLPSEPELAEAFGVSRAKVREALSRLAAQGLIEARRGNKGGTFVLAPHFRSFAGGQETRAQWLATGGAAPPDCVLEARLAMQSSLLPLAARRRTAPQIQAMAASIPKLMNARSPGAVLRADISFHTSLNDAAGNAFLTHHLAGMVAATQPLIGIGALNLTDRHRLAANHQNILRAIQTRDAAAAGRYLTDLAATWAIWANRVQKESEATA